MSKVLLLSHSGFSDENANGLTMKNILSAWRSDEKAEFYCDVEIPDYSAADDYFRVTDMQMLMAFTGRRTEHIFNANTNYMRAATTIANAKSAGKPESRIPLWLKKRKYHFGLKWLRELLWEISPWGHKALDQWIDRIAPDVVVYMVGESIFMDRLVLKTIQRTSATLVLYNGEAYRIIDIKTRKGLERAYYRKVENLYQSLNKCAALAIFNCAPLMERYAAVYPPHSRQIVAYNCASSNYTVYHTHSPLVISYFGNLGVGRIESLIQIADVLRGIEQSLSIDIYGNTTDADKRRLAQHENIRYHGFVPAQKLHDIAEKSDVLVHVESFDEDMISKLHYAFSTKIAQYLCAGRPVLCYAPEGSISSEYLKRENGALVATDISQLESGLRRLIQDPEFRTAYAERARQLGAKNHNREITAALVKREIDLL